MAKKIILLVTQVILIITLILIGSYVSMTYIWHEGVHKEGETKELVITDDMTIAEFKEKNALSGPLIKKVFSISDKTGLSKTIAETCLSEAEITSMVNKTLALEEESASKNWLKIRLKFATWFLFLLAVFILIKLKKMSEKKRILFYLSGIILFGVLLGSDPGPMGTIKDAIVLFGQHKTIFLPRMIALGIMLLLVIIANKFICSWGCQLGVLQDFLHRLAFKKGKSLLPHIKVPFALSNTIRIIFFVIFTAIAIIFTIDIIEPIDGFKIYKPLALGISGGVFVGIIVVLSLFTYRPWCHFFCPFGLTGWLAEKISVFRIRVNYDVCIACKKCSQVCPSTVMEKILTRKGIIPDCFACNSCIEACPVEAISFSPGRRNKPPEGKFKDTQN